MEFPITLNNQDEVDDFYRKRVAKDVRRAERDSGAEDYRRRAEEAEAALLRRDASDVLKEMGVDENRHDLILKHADLGDVPDGSDPANRTYALRRRIKDTHGVVPELFGDGHGVQQKGLDTSVRTEDEPLTEDAIMQMDRQERLSRWPEIKALFG